MPRWRTGTTRSRARSISPRDEDRDLNAQERVTCAAEAAELQGLRAELALLEERSISLQSLERSRQLGAAIDELTGRVEPRGHTPLLVSEAHLRSHADAIRNGNVFGAEERLEVETRANVTVATDMGSPGAWGAGNIREPVTLRRFAGIPNAPLTGATAQHPSVTFPTAAAGVTEAANAPEYDTIDVGNLSALRYGRWTQVTSFVDAFDDLTVIYRAHAVGVARDLNLADVTAIQTAAGTVTAFDAANLDRNVRQAILKVAAAALVEPDEVVIFGTSTALGVVTGFSPASGDDRGSVSTRVYGARVYVTESAAAGNVYCFAPQGFLTFSDRLRSASTIEPANGMVKFGQWVHSTPAGVAVVGAAAGVDVVTP
jgi:hypothetical protein